MKTRIILTFLIGFSHCQAVNNTLIIFEKMYLPIYLFKFCNSSQMTSLLILLHALLKMKVGVNVVMLRVVLRHTLFGLEMFNVVSPYFGLQAGPQNHCQSHYFQIVMPKIIWMVFSWLNQIHLLIKAVLLYFCTTL